MDTVAKLLAGTCSRYLAEEVARHYGSELAKMDVHHFSDGEMQPEIHESVRGGYVFIIQNTPAPADNLMELLLIVDAARRASADYICAVVPYFGYARQDRKTASRSPISAKLVANLITEAGANRVLTMDLHAAQIQGFFDIPVDNLYAAPLFSRHIQETYTTHDVMIVSPDVGGVVRARAIATRLNCDLAIIDKRRERAGVSEVMNVIGDVAGRDCILVDDLVDSGGTHCNAAEALIKRGARSASAYVTHGVLSGGAVARIDDSPIATMTITDSIQATEAVANSGKVKQLAIAPLLAEAMKRIAEESSVSSLFD